MKATIIENGPGGVTGTITFTCGHTEGLAYGTREAAETDARRVRPCWPCQNNAAIERDRARRVCV